MITVDMLSTESFNIMFRQFILDFCRRHKNMPDCWDLTNGKDNTDNFDYTVSINFKEKVKP